MMTKECQGRSRTDSIEIELVEARVTQVSEERQSRLFAPLTAHIYEKRVELQLRGVPAVQRAF